MDVARAGAAVSSARRVGRTAAPTVRRIAGRGRAGGGDPNAWPGQTGRCPTLAQAEKNPFLRALPNPRAKRTPALRRRPRSGHRFCGNGLPNLCEALGDATRMATGYRSTGTMSGASHLRSARVHSSFTHRVRRIVPSPFRSRRRTLLDRPRGRGCAPASSGCRVPTPRIQLSRDIGLPGPYMFAVPLT